MGFFSWIILGLAAGALGKFIMPGDDPGGFFMTIVIGIVGAIIGGFIGTLVGFGSVDGFNIGSLILAVVGTLVLLFAYRKFKGRAV